MWRGRVCGGWCSVVACSMPNFSAHTVGVSMHLFSSLTFLFPTFPLLLRLLFSPSSIFYSSKLTHFFLPTISRSPHHSPFLLFHLPPRYPSTLLSSDGVNLQSVNDLHFTSFRPFPFILLFLSYPLLHRLPQSGATLPLIIEDQRLCQRHLMVN